MTARRYKVGFIALVVKQIVKVKVLGYLMPQSLGGKSAQNAAVCFRAGRGRKFHFSQPAQLHQAFEKGCCGTVVAIDLRVIRAERVDYDNDDILLFEIL